MSENVRFDSVDVAILRALQANGRIANKTLAAEVGIAPSTCLDRTTRLRRVGAVTGFRATVDVTVLGRGIQALLAIQFQAHVRPLVDPFVEWVRSLPETLALHHVTGGDDFIVHVAATSTSDLQRLVLDFTARREVGRVQTHLIFQSWAGNPTVP